MGSLPRISCGWLSRLIADIPSDDDNTSATIFLPELSNTGIIRVNDECRRESCCRLLSWPLSVWFMGWPLDVWSMSCWCLGHGFGSSCGWFGRLITDIPSDGDYTSVSIFLPELSDARIIWVNDEFGIERC